MVEIPSKLDSWDKIIDGSGSDVPAKRDQARVKATKKLVSSITDLNLKIFSLQKVIEYRIDKLKDSIDKFNSETARLYKVNIWLTVIIALATIANVLVAIFR